MQRKASLNFEMNGRENVAPREKKKRARLGKNIEERKNGVAYLEKWLH